MTGFEEAYINGVRKIRLFEESLRLEKEISNSDRDFFYTAIPLMERKGQIDLEIKSIPRPKGTLEGLAYFLGVQVY